MSVEFINWYWIYSANIWGIYVIWRVSVRPSVAGLGNMSGQEFFCLLGSGVWSLIFGIWSLIFWCLAFDILVFSIWYFGILVLAWTNFAKLCQAAELCRALLNLPASLANGIALECSHLTHRRRPDNTQSLIVPVYFICMKL